MSDVYTCSFCKKPHTEVGPLVEGPDKLFLCEQCAEMALAIVSQEREKRLKASREEKNDNKKE